MANFWDLPKPVRQRIYRAHLVRDDKITVHEHRKLVGAGTEDGGGRDKYMPPIFHVSKRAEKEATTIYYGENHFTFSCVDHDFWGGWAGSLSTFARMIPTHHLRRIQKITIQWPGSYALQEFQAVTRLTGLKELYIGADEHAMVRGMVYLRYNDRYWLGRDTHPTAQQQMTLLRHPGMSALLAIKGVPKVEFVKREKRNGPGIYAPVGGEAEGGPLPGGFFETYVLPKLRDSGKPKNKKKKKKQNDSFRFLDLPPEIRNRVYRMLFQIDGTIQLSCERPSSMGRNSRDETKAVQSVLSVVGVNRQIHDEAVGLFYYMNRFEFGFPTRFHAFVNSLSAPRLNSVRDITLHYYTYKVGGINLIDLTMPLLKQLSLRRFHLICDRELCGIGYGRTQYHLDNVNPLSVPGMRYLFDVRGINDIMVRDATLENEVDEIKKGYASIEKLPVFSVGTKEHFYTELEKILAHFNAALADAQLGKVNKVMLKDKNWHTKNPFPTIEGVQGLGTGCA